MGLFWVVETVFDAGYSDTSKVLDGFDALAEEGIWEVFGVWLECGKATKSSELWSMYEGYGADISVYLPRHFTSPVQNFDSWCIGWRCVWRGSDFGKIFALLQHAKWSAKGQVTYDIECKVVEPI